MTLDIFIIVLACLFGLVMTWGVGANDLANIMSTTMGSKAVSVRQAVVIAIVFEFAGAFFGGADVTSTIRTGIINISQVQPHDYVVYGMLAILLAGSVWMWLASFLGMPVSITNAVVGALVGFGSIVLGMHTIHWEKVKYIALSWIFSPLIAGIVSYLFFLFIRKTILGRSNPAKAVKRYAPIYLFLIGVLLSIMVVLKGLVHFQIELSIAQNIVLDLLTALFVMIIGYLFIMRISISNHELSEQLNYVEKVFGLLMALTACAMVFAHGSNDVAIAMGPIAAIIGLVQHGGQLSANTPLPGWVIFMGCVGVVVGLFTYGKKVIATVGSSITALTPSRAFVATLSAATTVVVSTSTGTPVSATQTLVGAVLGVGLARGIGALNLAVIRNIFTSWVVTIPATALLAIGFFFLIKFIAH